jgi:hypothetical protein
MAKDDDVICVVCWEAIDLPPHLKKMYSEGYMMHEKCAAELKKRRILEDA